MDELERREAKRREAKRRYKLAERWLLDTERQEERYREHLESQTFLRGAGTTQIPPGGKSYLNTDRTATTAIRHVDELEKYLAWCWLIRDLEINLPFRQQLLLHVRRKCTDPKTRYEGFTYKLQKMYVGELKRLRGRWVPNPGPVWFTKTWREIVAAAVERAEGRGLFNR